MSTFATTMEHASPEEYDDRISEEDGSGEDDLEFKREPGTSLSLPTSTLDAAGKHASAGKSATHLQKRRRVTRACDECRRKKIKCDGKQPCTHCTVYSYECTYDQPSNRRRNPAPQYIENLEHRVHRAETLLHILIPNLDLNDPGIEAAVAQGWIPGAPGRGNPHAIRSRPKPQTQVNGTDVPEEQQNKSDTNLESMVRAVAQMDVDEQGHWDYHGHSSGLSFVRRMREQLGDLMGPDTPATPFVKTRPISQVLDSPKSMGESPSAETSPGGGLDLPQKEYAREVCSAAVDDAAVLLRFLHKPSFWQSFDRLYSTPPDQYSNEDNKFLPLLHTALALGHLFRKPGEAGLDQQGYENAIQGGFAHFKTARQMMDIADCRDLTSIQAVLFMILFLQSSAKLSQCYAYVGVALRSALRMGLHRAYAGNFNPVEAETRKRVFWVVRKMDIYVGAMLGLPQTLSEDDIDQDFPLEVDDEYITEGGVHPMPEGVVSLMTAFNAHTRLVQILSKIVRKVYPIKLQQGSPDKSYSVPFSVVRDIESDLEQWKNSLPPILSPCQAPERYTRIQQLLRLAYAHAQVLLYRPFLHFVAMEKRSKPIDQRAYACAASYVNVSRNIIHIATQMKQKGLLNGAFWFIMYTTFFAILSLVYFAAENPDNATTQAVMKDALEGRQILASLARRSMAADRCTATLNGVFQKLPDWMREGRQNPTVSRKRQFEHSPQPQQPPPPQSSRSHPNISVVGTETQGGPGQTRRSSTFPKHGAQVAMSTSPSSTLDPSWAQSGASSFGPQTPNSAGFDQNFFGGWGAQNASGSVNNNMQQYSLPPSFSNPALPDLSAMMFPAADEPFGYPNQPLTTFEHNQQMARANTFPSAQTWNGVDGASPVVPPPSRGREDNLEAQFFALPPYIEHKRQQQHEHQQQQQQQQQQPPNTFSQQTNMGFPNSALGFNSGQAMNAQGGMQLPSDTNWMSQQNNVGNINIQDIFGGAEWNSMFMNPGFTNQ
ncbi:hypothetical protein BAUCODRAFT_197012 [Baudoinia panamericana UAMH 10762]|uniref:Zn(2)-C6 fungal-type domain-containing protein n=1 Tax=Baudoinia panamericana (strain UAMH 10762) TaxID=717646 RepID=M2NNN2_BAUPA|nr:uncharacterized protein BAUCODRAFT_197012 [Baudoinia panamericana UAMH 10762]EMD01125.1 hypothetical protein BAUCODRAFT_197012 [Baudoinia panamericana UAMH 10762]